MFFVLLECKIIQLLIFDKNNTDKILFAAPFSNFWHINPYNFTIQNRKRTSANK